MRSKTPAQLFPFRLHTYSLLQASPSLRHTSTRRTSGHCLGTFKTGGKISLSPPPLKCSVFRYLPPLSLLSLSFMELCGGGRGVKEEKHINKLQDFQNKILRFITKLPRVKLSEIMNEQIGTETIQSHVSRPVQKLHLRKSSERQTSN
jgi:hypothetical protein